MNVKRNITIEEVIPFFNRTRTDVLEVVDERGTFIGYFTVDSLQSAIQKGELSETVESYVTNSVEYKDHLIEDGLPLGLLKNYKDILSSNFFLPIINSLHDGVYITDGEGITLLVNLAYERITGIKAREVAGLHMDELVKRGYISQSISLEVIKQKKSVTRMQTIKGDRTIIVSGTPIFSKQGEINLVISSVRDITELLKLKHELDGLQYWVNQEDEGDFLKDEAFHDLELYVASPKTKELFQLAEMVAMTDAKVLLQGETGVGKSLIARFIHKKSKRSDQPFIEINCGAIPVNLIEAELFGYEPGSFTGALIKGKKGLLEQVNGGTLFLDEIGDLPLDLQVKLLKVVEENRFMRIGSTTVLEVDVRIISATHKDLKKQVSEGKFRDDLYYRLNIVPIIVPPLHERKQEIIPLIRRFLMRFNEKYGMEKTINIDCLDCLSEYSWPGNIRELLNIVERLVVTTLDEEITLKHLPEEYKHSYHREQGGSDFSLKERVQQYELSIIHDAMKKYKTTRKVAEVLGVSQASIVQKLKKQQN
ncbi:sigma-54 interaction domain-containing protein [Halalkalibacter alkalisediminis]|uniref:HTH-type transcriptional regulatory protein TyrR n=1 Tax=Halalkalibacter alkalisediminis TaxID=935616 RepID=A0ABV6NFX0_9BACI|nr:sigma 54-interacting transcriptional regulator [Halalkalibacter alkalisediminis]